MPATWRLIVFIYNVFLIAVSASVVALTLGYNQPLRWLQATLVTVQDRVVTGTVAGFFVLVGIYLLVASLKPDKPQVATVKEGAMGEVCMTIPAIKQIILKAAKTVEGIREVRPVVKLTKNGLNVFLHLMINPDYKVPEMTETLQLQVNRYLEEIGGLQVAEIKVLVDDIAPQGPRVK